jgi:hypothetical protein
MSAQNKRRIGGNGVGVGEERGVDGPAQEKDVKFGKGADAEWAHMNLYAQK